jgi:hypothetical protein
MVITPTLFSQDEGASIAEPWGRGAPPWTLTEAGPEGVTVLSGGVPIVVGWHEVRAVRGPLAAPTAAYLEIGREARRALSRLERGDAFGGEPLFERLFERLAGGLGPTHAAVAEGLLRCRLRREARAGAVEAFLELHRNLLDAPGRQRMWGLRPGVIDPATLLAPALPPLWLDGPAARAFADQPVDPAPSGEPSAQAAWAMRTLYRAAAHHALGDPIEADAVSRAASVASGHPGGALIASMVVAQIGGEGARAEARALLERERNPGAERWRAAWAGLAIGRSLAREADEQARRRGVLELIALRVLDPGDSPYLTGLALADAALACEALGDLHAAGVLADELRRGWPAHPALSLPSIQSLRARGPGKAP